MVERLRINNFLHNDSTYILTFFSIFLVDAAFTPLTLVVAGLYHPIYAHFFKLPFIAMNGVAFLYFIFNRHKTPIFLKAAAAISIFALAQGLLFNQYDRVFFSHVYGATVPILGFYFGYNVLRANDITVNTTIEKLFHYVFYFLLLFMVVYFALIKIGVITYFGLSSTLPIFLAYFFARKKYFHVGLAFLAILLSGKRVALVQSTVVFLPVILLILQKYLFQEKSRFRIIAKLGLIVLVSYVTFAVLSAAGVLKRMTVMFSQGWDTAENLYNITAARSAEIVYAVISLNESPLKWLVGGGLGNYFWEPIGPTEISSFWRMHYSHFSPVHLVLLYGLPFAIYVYLFNIKIFLKALQMHTNFYGTAFLMFFLGSFFGSLMFVDIKYWFFAGAAKYFIEQRLASNE